MPQQRTEKEPEVVISAGEAVQSVEAEAKLEVTHRIWRWIIIAMAAVLVGFHLYTTIAGIFPALIQRSVHLGLALALCFALVPAKRGTQRTGGVPWYDAIFIILTIATTAYIPLVYDRLVERPLVWISDVDKAFAVILLLLILEAGRRTVGWTFPILVALSIIYALTGEHLPGMWGHSGYSLTVILQSLYHSSNGIWGMMLGISATILAIFAVFGATLIAIGAGESFFKLSQLLTGGSRGGAAKVAVFSSGLFGMISGSAVSNVVTTGNFTIPAMKRSGFTKPFAGAVEAVASTGGQIVPPVLGAGAFIMAQILGIPYVKIAIAAIIPALLYYLGAYVSVDLESRRRNIPPTSMSDWKGSFNFTSLILFLGPLVVFSYFLFSGYTPALGGVWAILAGLLLFVLFRPKSEVTGTRKSVPQIGVEVSIAAARTVLQIAALLACAQIVVAMVAMTGIGVKLSSFVIDFAGESLFLGLLLTAVVAIVLGMGLPTTAAYVIAASVLGPALIQLGVDPLVAHLFIFYFAVISTITPPVCAAVFMAAALAGANWWKTALEAMKLAVSSFIVPFAFVYSQSLLLMGPAGDILITSVTAAIGVFFLSVAVIGYLKGTVNILFRLSAAAAGVLLIVPNIVYSLIGLAIGIVVLAVQLLKKKSGNSADTEASAN